MFLDLRHGEIVAFEPDSYSDMLLLETELDEIPLPWEKINISRDRNDDDRTIYVAINEGCALRELYGDIVELHFKEPKDQIEVFDKMVKAHSKFRLSLHGE